MDTPKVVASLRELMNESNVYMQSKRGAGAIPHGGLLRRIVIYMTRLLDVCLLLLLQKHMHYSKSSTYNMKYCICMSHLRFVRMHPYTCIITHSLHL